MSGLKQHPSHRHGDHRPTHNRGKQPIHEESDADDANDTIPSDSFLFGNIGALHTTRRRGEVELPPARIPELGETTDESGTDNDDDDDDSGSEKSGTVIGEDGDPDLGDIRSVLAKVAKRRKGSGLNPNQAFGWNKRQDSYDSELADDEKGIYSSLSEAESTSTRSVIVVPNKGAPMIALEDSEDEALQKLSPSNGGDERERCSYCSSTGPIFNILCDPEAYTKPIRSIPTRSETHRPSPKHNSLLGSNLHHSGLRHVSEGVDQEEHPKVKSLCGSCFDKYTTRIRNDQYTNSTDDGLSFSDGGEWARRKRLAQTQHLQRNAAMTRSAMKNMKTFTALSEEGRAAFREIKLWRKHGPIKHLYKQGMGPCAIVGCSSLGSLSEREVLIPVKSDGEDGSKETSMENQISTEVEQFTICDTHLKKYNESMCNPDPVRQEQLHWKVSLPKLWHGIKSRATQQMSMDENMDFVDTVRRDPDWEALTERICPRNPTARGICAEEKFSSLPWCAFHTYVDLDKASRQGRHNWECSRPDTDRTMSCRHEVDHWFRDSLWTDNAKSKPLCEDHLSDLENEGCCISCMSRPHGTKKKQAEKSRSTGTHSQTTTDDRDITEDITTLERKTSDLHLNPSAATDIRDTPEGSRVDETDKEKARQQTMNSFSGGYEELSGLCYDCYLDSSHHRLDPDWLDDFITAQMEGRSMEERRPWVVRAVEVAEQNAFLYDTSD